MLRMTKNEFLKHVQQCVSKLYDRSVSYSMVDFKRDTDNVRVLPFNLSRFKLPFAIEERLNRICTEEAIGTNGELILRGRCPLENIYTLAEKLGMKQGEHLGYNGFFYNESQRMVMDFAEGDVSIYLCKTKPVYYKVFKSTELFYKEYNKVC